MKVHDNHMGVPNQNAAWGFEDLFFQFSMDDIDGFCEIKRLTGQLATVPDGLNDLAFYDKRSDPEYLEARSEVYSEPDVESMTRREGRRALKKQTPALRELMSKGAGQSDEPKTAWTIRQGHFSCDEPERLSDLNAAVESFLGEHCRSVGDFLYPRFGYRSWHTNRFDSVGWRMYLVQTDEAGKSFFRFVHPDSGELVTIWDQPDAINIFRRAVDTEFWHCVVSEETNRWSQGFVIPDDWRKRFLD